MSLMLKGIGPSKNNGRRTPGPADTLLEGLWAFWKLDEASGNRLDVSGNARHLAPGGTSIAQEAVGKIGAGVSLPNTAKLSVSLAGGILQPPFTFAGWVYSAFSNGGDIWTLEGPTLGPGDEKPLTLGRQNTSFGLVAVDTDLATYYPSPGTATATNTWHHLRMEMPDNQTVKLFINNETTPSVLIDSSPEAILLTDWETLILGKALSLGSVTQKQDALGIWARVLTQLEADWLYNSATGREWPFA